MVTMSVSAYDDHDCSTEHDNKSSLYHGVSLYHSYPTARVEQQLIKWSSSYDQSQ